MSLLFSFLFTRWGRETQKKPQKMFSQESKRIKLKITDNNGQVEEHKY